MLQALTELPDGIGGFEAVGNVSREDYEQVLEPALDDARAHGRRLRFLCELGPRFTGFTSGAEWGGAKIGLRSKRLFDGCAIVSDVPWIRESTRLLAFMMPCPVRAFGNGERAAAIEWLRALPARRAVSHRVIPQAGVIVVDAHAPLEAHDFDSLAVTVDTWVEGHGVLEGLVIRVREFPGWENFGDLLRQVRFVRDQHLTVKRVALAIDEKLKVILPLVTQHFASAEIGSFEYDQLDRATAWAGAALGRRADPARVASVGRRSH